MMIAGLMPPTRKAVTAAAKNRKSSFADKLCIVAKAFVKFPLLTIEFLATLPFCCLTIPRPFVMIYTYDRMIRRHTASLCTKYIRPL